MKYITIRVAKESDFKPKSFRTVWVSKTNGIKGIMGSGSKHREIQTYLFDKDIWKPDRAVDYIKHKSGYSRAELLGKNKTIVTGSMTLCETKPELSGDSFTLHKLTKEGYEKLQSQASLNDKYYFYTEFVHEGANGNGDYFFEEELVNNYESAAHQIIDWEHQRDQIIGFSLNAQLIKNVDKPMAVGSNGVLNRISPYMQVEDRVTAGGFNTDIRDNIIRDRFFSGQLFTSMEVVFDAFKCIHCEYEVADFMEFDYHMFMNHAHLIEEGKPPERGLKGIDFIGYAIVESPADTEADVTSLRTDDEGNIKVSIAAKDLAQKLVHNISFSQNLVINQPDIDMLTASKIVVADKHDKKRVKEDEKNKNKKKKTKKEKDNENIDEQAILSNDSEQSKGGQRMFKLKDKISEAKHLSDVFVIAQNVLKDYVGDNDLSEDDIKNFSSELSEVVASYLSDNDVNFNTVYTLSASDKLEAITEARKDEQKKAQEKTIELETSNANVVKEKETLQAEITELESANKTLKEAEKKKENELKLEGFISKLKDAGVSLTGPFEESIRNLAMERVDDDEKLTDLSKEIVASIKQSTLAHASEIMGGASSAGDTNSKDDMSTKLENARKKYKEDK